MSRRLLRDVGVQRSFDSTGRFASEAVCYAQDDRMVGLWRWPLTPDHWLLLTDPCPCYNPTVLKMARRKGGPCNCRCRAVL